MAVKKHTKHKIEIELSASVFKLATEAAARRKAIAVETLLAQSPIGAAATNNAADAMRSPREPSMAQSLMRKLVKARAGYETLEPKHHTSSAASVEKRSALDLGLVGARLAFQCCAAGSQIRRRAVTPHSSPKRAARFQAPPGWRAFLSRSAPLRLWRSLSTMERSLDSVLVLKVVSKDHVYNERLSAGGDRREEHEMG